MENPFFRNGRRYPQHPVRYPFSQSPTFGGGAPVHQFDPSRETLRSSPPERTHGSKVVQIPVHFVGSEQPDRPGSALKVQKVFRGFLVRKCLKKIKDIKSRVDEIEERLSKGEVMELVRRDSKERLRMNEELMSLLLKLDSICGLDFGVRGCRKSVIRKAIALQEMIDAIVAGEIEVDTSENGGNQKIVVVDDRGFDTYENEGSQWGDDGEDEIVDVGVDREVMVVSEENHCGVDEEKGKGSDESERGNRELLERIMEENEKMTRMMTQMFETNENQSRMINALTNRVEMLEKAFVCDGRMRKKAKKNKNKKA